MTQLTSKLDKRLFSYAAAASAAGVSLLAANQAAEAKIVYTAANVTIAGDTAVALDLNNDGTPDFGFYFYTYNPKAPLGHFDNALSVHPQNTGNEIRVTVDSKGIPCAAALAAGAKVQSGQEFDTKPAAMWISAGTAYSGPNTLCQWGKLHRGAYLGLKFLINGEIHYGWAHVTVGRTSATLNGYAYETVPNQPILSGKTSGQVKVGELEPPTVSTNSSLGALALGSYGLQIWRRPEESEG